MRERMGSGGLRGLQILRLGVKSARGGFDSHAFPPILAILVMIAGAGVPASAHAQNLGPSDSVLVVPRGDSIVTIPQKADTTGNRKLGLFDQPRFVMARSLVFPGWGQAHNHAWFKAVVIAGAEWYLIASLVQDDRALKDLNEQIDAAQAAGDFDTENMLVDQYNARLNTFVAHQWWLGGVVIYSMADAYVDAHFVNFKFEFEHDRALRGHTAGARISVEKKF